MLHLYEMKLVAVLFDKFHHIAGIYEYRRCVIARMDAHQLVLEVLIDVYDNVFLLIREYAQRRHRAADEPHLVHEVFFGSERERTRIVLLAELLEIYFLIFKACYELVFALFIITNEEVLGYLLRMRKPALKHLVYGINRLVLYYLIFDIVVIKDLYCFFFCECHIMPFLHSRCFTSCS